MIWFTSDLHFGHRNIISFCDRPFVDSFHETPDGTLAVTADAVTTMNEAMIEQWNSQVAPIDSVYIVGDVCMGHRDETLPLVGRCNGDKHLIPGNHDHIWSGHAESMREKWLPEYQKYMTIEPEQMVMEVDGMTRISKFLVGHFPYAPKITFDGVDSRYSEYWPEDTGRWLVHGHAHGSWRQRGKQIDVGIDAWGGRLVPIETIASMIELGPAMLDRIPWRR